jgi:predicted DNA-binding ribbon-helix-helix protein
MPDHRRYVSTLENFNLRIKGRWTTVRMEPLIMDALRAIALAESKSLHELCTQIVAKRTAGSVTSSLRLAATAYFRDRCEAIAGPLSRSSSLASEILTYRNLHLETDDHDYVVRNQKELSEAHAEHPGLGFLLAYWRALGNGQAPCTVLDLEPLRRVDFLQWVHIIDVSPSDPNDYCGLRQAPATLIYRRPDNTPLRAFGSSLYVQSLKADYESAKRTRQPSFQRLSVKSPEGSVRYHRLILPMGREDGTIDRLVVGVYPIAPRARRETSRP